MISQMRQELLLSPYERYIGSESVLNACQRSPCGAQHPRNDGKADSSTSVGSQDHFSPLGRVKNKNFHLHHAVTSKNPNKDRNLTCPAARLWTHSFQEGGGPPAGNPSRWLAPFTVLEVEMPFGWKLMPLTDTWDKDRRKRRQTYERRWSCRWRGACRRGCGRQRRRWTRGLASRFSQSSTSSPWNLQLVRKLSFFFIYLWLISLCSSARTCKKLSW